MSRERCYRLLGEASGGVYAVEGDGDGEDVLRVLTVAPGESFAEEMRDAVSVRARGVEVWWRPGRAVLQCEAEQAEALVAGVVEFALYERALRGIEEEIEAGWGELEQDKALAFDVTPADLKRGDVTGARMGRAFQRRIRYARLEPHLYAADGSLSQAARKLGDELRERVGLEARAEAVDGQLEVYEHIYEMASQRLGEYRAARQGHLMELIIIWLLALEAALMVAQTIFRWRV